MREPIRSRERHPPDAELAGRSLRIGVIAAEFAVGHGGMQEHARGLVANLAGDHDVVVYTSQGASDEAPRHGISVHPVLHWRAAHDLPVLAAANVDAWITLNAGLSSYSTSLSAPTFAYVHGNDFTRPWLPHPDRTVRLAGRLLGEGVVDGWRRRRIGAGLLSARWVFANSAFSRELCARSYGIAAARISVVPPGMNADFYASGSATRPIRQAEAADGCLRLVSVARLAAVAERKNIDGVIEAIALLKREIDIEYTIIGDGDDLERLRAKTQSLGIADDVRFLGAVETSRIVEEFCRSDVFIMAVRQSGNDVEGFGMVFAEAAATGLPSIGANIGGIPEVIEHEVSGLLLDDVSAGGIANGLRHFVHRRSDFDPELIRTKAARFSAPHCTAMIAQIIDEKLQDAPR